MRGTRKVLRMPICFERSSQYGTARSYVRMPPLPRSPGCLHSTQRRCCVVDMRPGHGVHGLVRNRREYFDTAMHWRVIIDPDPGIAHS